MKQCFLAVFSSIKYKVYSFSHCTAEIEQFFFNPFKIVKYRFRQYKFYNMFPLFAFSQLIKWSTDCVVLVMFCQIVTNSILL